jgi:hypothetical protein
MKKLIFLILSLLLFGVFADAQTITYQPLHGNYTQYVYRHLSWNGSENGESFSITIWSGDTTINGESYTRIFQAGLYFGGIREDVPNQQRFFVDLNNVEKEITIDHFLTVGTTLTDSAVFLNAFRTYADFGSAYNIFDTLYIEHADSVLESNGTYSMTYQLRTLPYPVSFIYNTYRGLLSFTTLEFYSTQVCYREDGEQTPPGQETPWTYLCDLGISENNLLEITISPNPSMDFIELSGKDLSLINELTIYDLHGKIVKQIPQSEINTKISLEELESGVYLLALNGNSKMLRLIKQ